MDAELVAEAGRTLEALSRGHDTFRALSETPEAELPRAIDQLGKPDLQLCLLERVVAERVRARAADVRRPSEEGA